MNRLHADGKLTQLFDNSGKIAESNLGCGIGERRRRIGVHLEKQTVHSGSDSGTRKRKQILTLPA